MVSSFPPWDDYAIWREKSFESVELNAYIFAKNPRPTSWQTSMSLPAKISESDLRYEIFQVGNISW